jgi:copper oxidase (laccase) domain-containing protein
LNDRENTANKYATWAMNYLRRALKEAQAGNLECSVGVEWTSKKMALVAAFLKGSVTKGRTYQLGKGSTFTDPDVWHTVLGPMIYRDNPKLYDEAAQEFMTVLESLKAARTARENAKLITPDFEGLREAARESAERMNLRNLAEFDQTT